MGMRKKNSEIIPGTGSILIVDDEEIAHLTLKRLLKDEGFTIDSAYSGKEALSKVGAGYDLIICDIRMPDMDGIEALKQIKRRQVDAEVIMLTGYAAFDSAVKALNFGAFDYLMKPIEDISGFRNKVYKGIKKAQITRRNKKFYDSVVSGKLPAYQMEIGEIIKYIMELLHEGIVFLDANGIITFHNVCFNQMLNGEYHVVLGSRFESYIAEEDRGKINDALKRLAEGETVACVHSILKTNYNKHLPVIIDFASVYVDEKFNVVATIKDIDKIMTAGEKAEIITKLLMRRVPYDVIFVSQLDGSIKQCNTLLRNPFSYTCEEMLSLNIKDLFKNEQIWENTINSVRQNKHWEGELLAVDKTGGNFPVEVCMNMPTTAEDILFFMRDITERKKAEDDLRENMEKLQCITTSAKDAIVMLDNEGNIAFWNEAAEKMFGYSKEEITGKEMHIFLEPERYHEAYKKGFSRFKETGQGPVVGKTLEKSAIRKDGMEFPVELSVSSVKVKGKWNSIAIIRDITERKMMEREMIIRNQIAHIFGTVTDAEVYGEVLRVILDATDSKYGIFGYIDENDTLIIPSMTRDIWELCQMPDKTIEYPREKWGGIWGRALVEKKSLYANEGLHVPEGHVPVTKVLVVPIIYGEEAIGLLEVANKAAGYDEKDQGFLEKIANKIAPILDARLQRDRKERELSDAKAELQKAYQELKDTYIQLVQAGKMTAMGEMAAGVAHELTQPLFGIKGFTTALLGDLGRNPQTEATKSMVADLEIIQQQTDRMLNILNMIREFAHASGTEVLPLNINKPIEDALLLFSEQLRLHNIVVEKNLSRDLPLVLGNANQLQQVFINLITNSRDAINAKGSGGRLEIKTGTSPVDASILIEVVDNGIGADAETMSKMFNPFFTNKRAGSGVGLGLSIVDRIIKEHMGTIDVQSEPGQGCKISIRLPIND